MVARSLSRDLSVSSVGDGLLVQAGSHPVVGDITRTTDALGPIREVARLTQSVRVTKRVLFYGSEEFRHHWLHRFDA